MFTAEERERIRKTLIEKARSDPRITAAAAVGGSAVAADRWSDLDLTFGVANDASVSAVLADWTADVVCEFGAAVLFDLPVQSSIYRVFLLPGKLQVDLSFTPADEFGARGPRFDLLFGQATEYHAPPSPPPEQGFGLAVHHAVRAHICIERGRLWQAEYWIHALRCEAMALACGRLGLETSHGRGFDRLPPDLLDSFADSLVGSVTAVELRRALAGAATVLLREADFIPQIAPWVRSELEDFRRPVER